MFVKFKSSCTVCVRYLTYIVITQSEAKLRTQAITKILHECTEQSFLMDKWPCILNNLHVGKSLIN